MPVERDDDHYRIAASLVHKLIAAIFAALIGISGYMMVWGLDDRAYKVEMTARLFQCEQVNEKQDGILERGILPRTEERINSLESRVRQVEMRQKISLQSQ